MATTPMRHLVAVFTPSATDPETLAAFTVGRNTERDVLARAIDEAATGIARAHALLVGSRGAGKSHLLALAAHHARTQHPGDRVKVAQLPEDLYAVASYRDLLAELLAAAAGTRPDAAATADALEAGLVELAGSGVVVAVVENLHRIMAIIGRDGQHALRAFLHNQSALLLLASTPSLFEGVTSHAEPFYGAFRVLALGELSAEDGRELLLLIARLDGDDALGTFLSSETGLTRLRAVAHLAGGLPRLWLLLAGCITVELLDELVPLFVKLLDELTPYYKARMDDLSPAKARVVSALCFARSGGAMTVRDLAAVTGTTQQTCSKLLHDLERDRFVVGRKIPGTDQRVTFYEVREPLLRHCLELKVSHGRPLALIVDVLRNWYDATTLRQVLASADVGAPSELYTHAALFEGRLEPSDRAYARADRTDLLVEMRRRQGSEGVTVATAVVEAVAMLATDEHAAGAVLDARLATLAARERATARSLFDRAVAASGGRTDADAIAEALIAAYAAVDPADPLLALMAGGWLLGTERWADSVALLRPAFEHATITAPHDRDTLSLGAELAFGLWQLGDRGAALDLASTVETRRETMFGADDPDTLTSRSNLAHWTGEAGDYTRARDLFESLANDRARILGPDHPDTRAARRDAIRMLASTGEPTLAIAEAIKANVGPEFVGQLALAAGRSLRKTISDGAAGHDELRARLRPLSRYPSAVGVVLLFATVDDGRFDVAAFVAACRTAGATSAIAGTMPVVRHLLPDSYVNELAKVAAALDPTSGHEALARAILHVAVRAANGDGAALAELPPESRALAEELSKSPAEADLPT